MYQLCIPIKTGLKYCFRMLPEKGFRQLLILDLAKFLEEDSTYASMLVILKRLSQSLQECCQRSACQLCRGCFRQ